ncbi:tobamovirus multiplication protein 1, partial [Tanacetum coccineum]
DNFLVVKSDSDEQDFLDLMRIHSRNPQRGWTRQKVFHLMIGFSNTGYGIYFILTLVAACKNWICWSNSCGFVVMALPKILFLAAFLLLLSFWVDLCHQANDEDEDEGFPREPLLEKVNKANLKVRSRRRCCNIRIFPVGSRQQVVILVTLLIFVIMLASAVLIWIGLGKNPIDSSVVARVAGLAIVSVICFTASSVVAFFTNIPVLYHCDWRSIGGIYASLLLILYYFIGSSVPSAFVLWIMRELPPSMTLSVPGETRTLAFVSEYPTTTPPQHWTTIATAQNQASRASPI